MRMKSHICLSIDADVSGDHYLLIDLRVRIIACSGLRWVKGCVNRLNTLLSWVAGLVAWACVRRFFGPIERDTQCFGMYIF